MIRRAAPPACDLLACILGCGRSGQRAAQRTTRAAVALASLLALAACATPPHHPDVAPHLDLARFAGTWYEIARFPNDFEDPRGHRCEDVVAVYKLRRDQTLDMRHSCRDVLDGNAERVSSGQGYASEPGSAKLRVSFHWPFYTDLWIIAVDPNYRWVVAASPSRRYLWLLSRTPTPSSDEMAQGRASSKAQGFDITRLHSTQQQR